MVVYMKNKFVWISILSLAINIVAYAIFVLLLQGGLYQSIIWYMWIVLCIITPFVPLLSKWIRNNNSKAAAICENISLVMSLFNTSNVLKYAFKIENGDLYAWALITACELMYWLVIKPKKNKEKIISRQEDVNQFEDYDILVSNKEKISSDNEYLLCKECGAKMPKDRHFCAACGNKFVNTSNKCSYCGEKILDGAKFCNKCGKEVE